MKQPARMIAFRLHRKGIVAAISILLTLPGCMQPESGRQDRSVDLAGDEASETTLAINASQHGVAYPETFILMQNRHGVRIEYCVDRSNLQLWISPQAGKSMSYRDRNWSSRDDFTSVFDRVLIPGPGLASFDSCSWDPFHSRIYFREQVLHLAQVYDQPMVLVWLERPGAVDFKIYGREVERSSHRFIVDHTDRGREFQSAAVLSPGAGTFQHQLVLDSGRSIHARAHLEPGQFLVIGSEIVEEQIGALTAAVAGRELQDVLQRNEQLIAQDLSTGLFQLKDHPRMQKLMDVSRRVALSMQDVDGFMRSTNQYIYYLLWYRDGGMNTAHLGYSGWIEPAFDQARFSLLNPNSSPDGPFYGQVMGGPITKWEEDGLFYVLWPAFTYWTQTGDDRFLKDGSLETAKQAMRWLEEYCFDQEKGLFGRYYYCETPLNGSRDQGWDNATGAPATAMDVWYKGHGITRSYDLYINLLNYSNYLMLSAMSEGEEASEYLRKAKDLEARFLRFYGSGKGLPDYGMLLTESGEEITADPYGLDIWDYVWGLSLPPFTPTLPEAYRDLRNQVREDMTTTRDRYFICVYNAMLTSMDPLIHGEEDIMRALEMLIPESIRPGKYLPMPYSVPELINIEDGDPFHDVRPLVYSIAPWMSAITNLGVRRLPFGIAFRPTGYLEKIERYRYLDGFIDLHWEGEGEIAGILVNGVPLSGSYQLPDTLVREGANTVRIRLEKEPADGTLLVSSTVRLHRMEEGSAGITAYGKNVLTFRNLGPQISILDSAGASIPFEREEMDHLSYIEFEGRGTYQISW